MAEAAEDLEGLVSATTSPEGSAEASMAISSPKATTPKRNAFTELMAPKVKAPKLEPSLKSNNPRDALLAYILHPENFPRNIVLRITPNTVLIKDLFPKAAVHLLLLPRSAEHYDKHPHQAFEDPEFLQVVRDEATSAAHLAAAELKRQMTPFSSTVQARNKAIDSGIPANELPSDRDFRQDIRIGVHAHPSMNHLHVHIISRDMHSDRLKHRKHYNSFNTPFFIPLEDYPLPSDDKRRDTGYQNANLKRDFICWRCGRGFGNRFSELKMHLEAEFQEWSKQ